MLKPTAPARELSGIAEADAPAIEDVAAAVYVIPTDAPEADGTLAWDETTMVLVTVRAGGEHGTGWSYAAANGGYTTGQAVRVAHELAGYDVTWFEEPVSSQDLAGLATVRSQVLPDVTAGEPAGPGLAWSREPRMQTVTARHDRCLEPPRRDDR